MPATATATVQALRPTQSPPPAQSPERHALREAIERHAQVEERLAKINAAQERASSASINAMIGAKQARVALAEAQQNESRHLAARVLGEVDSTSDPIADAKHKLEQAEQQHETARATRNALEVEARTAESELASARSHLDAALRNVLREAPEVQQLLADLDVAKKTVADVVLKLISLPPGVTGDFSWNLNEFNLGQQPKHPRWEAAVAQLKTDADAVLPSG